MAALWIGTLSGTCADSVDAAAFSFADGCHLLATHKNPFPVDFSEQIAGLRSAISTLPNMPRSECKLENDSRMRSMRCSRVKACGAGKSWRWVCTVKRLYIVLSEKNPFTAQLGDPSVVAVQTELSVVADFRSTDVALGG